MAERHDPREAAIVVAATGSESSSADYHCSGAADEVQINLALAELASTGGRVILSEGTFTIVAPITLPGNNITLMGQGEATFIDGDGLSTGEHAILVPARTNCVIRDLRIQTEDGGDKVCHCIYATGACNGLEIYEVVITDSDSDGIHIEPEDAYDIHIHNCTIDDADGYGIFVDPPAGDESFRLHVKDCLVIGTGSSGIYLGNTGDGNLYCEINNNLVSSAGGQGMQLLEMFYCNISNNICISNTSDGIILNGSHTVIEGGQYYSNGGNGVELATAIECSVEGNVCVDNTGSGIELDGASDRALIGNNHCCGNTLDGIRCGGTSDTIAGNYCYDNGLHGINLGNPACEVSGNFIYDNSQTTAETYHGINVGNDADRSSIHGNYIDDPGDATEDGIYLVDGATECEIDNNYIYNLMGSGIMLTANNDYCKVTNNYIHHCDDYGIEIAAATCDKNLVRGNQLTGNITGAILDSGTLTQVGDDNEGIDLINIKIYRTVKNTSGAQRVAGDVVVIKGIATAVEVTTTAAQGDDKVYGMVAETIANAASGYVLVKGFTAVLKADGTDNIAINDILGTFTTACIAMKAGAGDQGFALALEAYETDDSNGVLNAYLNSPWD